MKLKKYIEFYHVVIVLIIVAFVFIIYYLNKPENRNTTSESSERFTSKPESEIGNQIAYDIIPEKEEKTQIEEKELKRDVSSSSPIKISAENEIKTLLLAMDILCIRSWADGSFLYFMIDDSLVKDANGLAQSFCYTARNDGYEMVVIRNLENRSIGRYICK
jgi:Ca2+/Na+ antiporter